MANNEYVDYVDNAGGTDYVDYVDSQNSDNSSGFDAAAYVNSLNYESDNMVKLQRAEELKRKELYRTTQQKLKMNEDGTLKTDSDVTIMGKEVVNKISSGLDWLLEATEVAVDYGQGDFLDFAKMDATVEGKDYSMGNKDFLAARGTTLDSLIEEYNNEENDSTAESTLYTLRKFDGYDETGSEKFLYKYGVSQISASHRYKEQAVADGYDIIGEKSFDGAEKWEKTFHSLTESLEARALDYGMVRDENGDLTTTDKASGVDFGTGYTELYKKDLLNLSAGQDESDFALNRQKSDKLRDEYAASGYHDDSLWGRSKNTAKAGAAMLAKTLVVDTVDWIAELSTLGDIGTGEEKREMVNKFFGYDDYFSQKSMERVSAGMDDMLQNGFNWESFKKVSSNAFASAESTGESVGFIVGLTVGVGKFTKAGQLLSKVEKLQAAGKLTSAAAKTRAARVIEKTTLAQRANYTIAKNAGLLNMSAGMTSDQIDDYKENNEGVGPSAAGVVAMALTNVFSLALERGVDIAVLKASSLWKKEIKDVIDDVPKKELAGILRHTVEAVKKAGSVTGSMGMEFGQEYVQTILEQVNTKYGTKTYGNNLDEILSNYEVQLEALSAGAMGSAGATHFAIAGAPVAAQRYSQKLIDEEKNYTARVVQSNNINFTTNAMKETDPQKIYEEFDTHIKTQTGNENIVAQSDENDQYSADEVIDEAKAVFTFAVQELTNEIQAQIDNGDSLDTVPLGTGYAVIRRLQNTILKLKNTKEPLTDEQKQVVVALDNEVKSRRIIIENAMYKTTRKLTDAEREALTSDQLVVMLGGESKDADGNTIIEDTVDVDDARHATLQEVRDIDSPDYDVTDEDGSTDHATDESVIDDVNADLNAALQQKAAADQLAKEGKIANIKELQKKLKAKVEKKKRHLATLKGYRDRDSHDKDTGLLARAKMVLENEDAEYVFDHESRRTLDYTKKWMVENNYVSKDGKTFDSVDDIDSGYTAEEREAGKVDDIYDFFKSGLSAAESSYYTDMKEAGYTSVFDLSTLRTQLNKRREKLITDTGKKIDNRAHKLGTLTVATQEQETKALEKIKEAALFVTNADGNKVPKTNSNGDKLYNIKESTTQIDDNNEFIYVDKEVTEPEFKKHLKKTLGAGGVMETYDLVGKKDKKIQITSEDVVNRLFETLNNRGLEEKDQTHETKNHGVYKWIRDMEYEKKSYESLLVSDHKIKLDSKYRKDLEEYQKELLIKEGFDPDVDLKDYEDINPYTFKKMKLKLEKYEKHLRAASQEIQELYAEPNKSTGITSFEESYLASVLDTENGALMNIATDYFAIQNDLKKKQGNKRDINKELKQIEKDIKAAEQSRKDLEEAAKALYKTKHAEVRRIEGETFGKTDADLETEMNADIDANKDKTNAKDLKSLFAKFANGIRKILTSMVKVNNQIAQLKDQRKSLLQDQKDVDKQITARKQRLQQFERIVQHTDNIDIKQVREDAKTAREEKLKKLEYKKKLFLKAVKEAKEGTQGTNVARSLLREQAKNEAKRTPTNNKLNIPTKFSEFADVANKTGSLLAVLPFNSLLKVVDSKTKAVIDGYSKEVELFITEGGIHQALLDNRLKNNIDYQDPGMVMLMDSAGKINKSVAAAIGMSVDTLIRNDSSDLFIKDMDATKRMMGIPETAQMDKETYNEMKDRTRVNNLANTLGKDILKMLGITEKSVGSTEAYARLVSGIGAIGVMHMLHSKGFEANDMLLDQYQAMLGSNGTATDYEVSVENQMSLVKFISRKKDDEGNRIKFDAEEELMPIQANIMLLEDNVVIPRNQHSLQKERQPIIPYDKSWIAKNNVTIPTEPIWEAIQNLQQQTHFLHIDGVNKLNSLFSGTDGKTPPRDLILKALGYKTEEDLASLSLLSEDKDKMRSTNLGIEAEYDNLMTLFNDIDSGTMEKNEFWFNYFTGKNNRLNIDSVLIDPQTKKELHRWLVSAENHVAKYDTKDLEAVLKVKITRDAKGKIDAKTLKALGLEKKGRDVSNVRDMSTVGALMGVAQAFGYDIDKFAVEDSMAFAIEIMNMSKEAREKLVMDGKTDHLGHGVQALTFMDDYESALSTGTKEFSGLITAEYDGITNGTILKLLQIPLSSRSMAFLLKGGIVFDVEKEKLSDGEYQTGVDFLTFDSVLNQMGESTQDRAEIKRLIKERDEAKARGEEVPDIDTKDRLGKILDVYYTQAASAKMTLVDIAKRIDKAEGANRGEDIDFFGLMEKDEEGNEIISRFIPNTADLLNKALREMFKYPTMIINYGGAIRSVVASVASTASREMMAKLLKDYTEFTELPEDTDKETDEYKEMEKAYNEAYALLLDMSGKMKLKNVIHTVVDGKDTYTFSKEPATTDNEKMFAILNALRTQPLSKIRGEGKSLEDKLSKLYAAAVGEAVGSAIYDNFGDMIEVTTMINETSRGMFESFEKVINREIKILKEEALAKGEIITREQINEVIERNKRFMPIFKGPASTDTDTNGIAIFESGKAPDDEMQFAGEKPSVHYIDSDGEMKSFSVSAYMMRIKSAWAAAGVMPTHTEDAVGLATTINKWIETHGIIAVHDALVLSGMSPQEVLKFFNETFVTISRGYDLVDAVADRARSVYEHSIQYEKDNDLSLNLSDTRSEAELVKAKDGDKPRDMLENVVAMELAAEQTWNEKRKLHAHAIKADQFPGNLSMAVVEPLYNIDIFSEQLIKRIERRNTFYEDGSTLSNKKTEVAKFVKTLLSMKRAGKKLSVGEKILQSVAITEAITDLMSGVPGQDKEAFYARYIEITEGIEFSANNKAKFDTILNELVDVGIKHNEFVEKSDYVGLKERIEVGKEGTGTSAEEEINTEVSTESIGDIREAIVAAVELSMTEGETSKNTHIKKDITKINKATKFIGTGKKDTSTKAYFDLFNDYGLANQSEYDNTDTVFVSVNGGSYGITPVALNNDGENVLVNGYEHIEQAIESGATIILDNKYNRERSYNKTGELALFKYLSEKADEYGYEFIEGENSTYAEFRPVQQYSDTAEGEHEKLIVDSIAENVDELFTESLQTKKSEKTVVRSSSKASADGMYLGSIQTNGKKKTFKDIDGKVIEMDNINNFSVPFVPDIKHDDRSTRNQKKIDATASILGEQEYTGGVNQKITDMTYSESRFAFYNWLDNNEIPDGYPEDQRADLEKKRNFILKNLNSVAFNNKYISNEDQNAQPFTSTEALLSLAIEQTRESISSAEGTGFKAGQNTDAIKAHLIKLGVSVDVESTPTSKTATPKKATASQTLRKYKKKRKTYGKSFTKKKFYRGGKKRTYSNSRTSKFNSRRKKTSTKRQPNANKFVHYPEMTMDNKFQNSKTLQENNKSKLIPQNNKFLGTIGADKQNTFGSHQALTEFKQFVSDATSQKNKDKLFFVDNNILELFNVDAKTLMNADFIKAIKAHNIIIDPAIVAKLTSEQQASVKQLFEISNEERKEKNAVIVANRKNADDKMIVTMLDPAKRLTKPVNVKLGTSKKMKDGKWKFTPYKATKDIHAHQQKDKKGAPIKGKFLAAWGDKTPKGGKGKKDVFYSIDNAVASLSKTFKWDEKTNSERPTIEEFVYSQLFIQNPKLVDAIIRQGGIDKALEGDVLGSIDAGKQHSIKTAFSKLNARKKNAAETYRKNLNTENPNATMHDFYNDLAEDAAMNEHVAYPNSSNAKTYSEVIAHNKENPDNKYVLLANIQKNNQSKEVLGLTEDENFAYPSAITNDKTLSDLEKAHKYLMWVIGDLDLDGHAEQAKWIRAQIQDENSDFSKAYKNNMLVSITQLNTSDVQGNYNSNYVPALLYAKENISDILSKENTVETDDSSEHSFNFTTSGGQNIILNVPLVC
ncbi:MAG: hypothetical protein KAH01_07605 [Caldisericia bacterium]|nr:hypothetical protein [Caldisericia bacterium]